jgi:DNA polymerase III delta subunit
VEVVAAAPDLKPVYLLTGSDRPKIETALARLRRHFEQEAVELVTAQEVSGADAAALCNVGSLFGDARLVVIEGVDGRRNADAALRTAGRSPM